MKLYHINYGRPIGPSFQCYIEKPKEEYNTEECPYGRYIEEITLEEISKQFIEHIKYAIDHFPKDYFPYKLEINIKEGK